MYGGCLLCPLYPLLAPAIAQHTKRNDELVTGWWQMHEETFCFNKPSWTYRAQAGVEYHSKTFLDFVFENKSSQYCFRAKCMVWVNNRLTFYELYGALRNMETFHNIHVPSQNTVFVKINVVLTASHLFFFSLKLRLRKLILPTHCAWGSIHTKV